MGETTTRTFRIEDDIYNPAMARAGEEGETLSSLIRGWLSDYAAGRKRVGPNVPGAVEVSRAELTQLRALIDSILQ